MADFRIVDRSDHMLAVQGDVDLATAPQLATALASRGPDVQLDLSECTFIDSSGITVLIEAKIGSVPGLVVVRPSPPVARVLALCGVTPLLVAPEPASS